MFFIWIYEISVWLQMFFYPLILKQKTITQQESQKSFRKLSTLKAQPQRLLIFLTSAVIIDNCDSFPLEELHQVQNGTAEWREVWVETDIEGVFVVWHLVLPAGLDVGNPQSIADRLNCICWRAVRRPEDGSHPKRQLITGCRGDRSLSVMRGDASVPTGPHYHCPKGIILKDDLFALSITSTSSLFYVLPNSKYSQFARREIHLDTYSLMFKYKNSTNNVKGGEGEGERERMF